MTSRQFLVFLLVLAACVQIGVFAVAKLWPPKPYTLHRAVVTHQSLVCK